MKVKLSKKKKKIEEPSNVQGRKISKRKKLQVGQSLDENNNKIETEKLVLRAKKSSRKLFLEDAIRRLQIEFPEMSASELKRKANHLVEVEKKVCCFTFLHEYSHFSCCHINCSVTHHLRTISYRW